MGLVNRTKNTPRKALPSLTYYVNFHNFHQFFLLSFFCLHSKGSVVVDFKVTFDENVSEDQACSDLKNAVKDGKLGSFKVDNTSVKCIAPTAQSESKEPTKGNYPLA